MFEPTPGNAGNKFPLIAAMAAAGAMLAATLFSDPYMSRYVESDRHLTTDAKLQIALQAYRSGHDAAALKLLAPLANAGDAKAQYWLADIYDNDPGAKSDAAKALALLQKSAEHGFAPAETRLGTVYLNGTTTLQDFGKAQFWLSKAATAGDAKAREQLGRIFAVGLGVPQDKAEAYGWYENATLRGNQSAESERDELLKRMSPTEINKGEQIAGQIAANIKPAQS